MKGIDAFMLGIFHCEGQAPHDDAVQNCNPGNIRDSEDVPHTPGVGGFPQFSSIIEGFHALRALIIRYGAGEISFTLHWDSTLVDFFAVYAPSRDSNDPAKYAANMAWWLSAALQRNVGPFTTLRDIMPEEAEAN